MIENGRVTMLTQAFINAVGKDRAYDHVRWAGNIPDTAQCYAFPMGIYEDAIEGDYYFPCEEKDAKIWQLNFYWFSEGEETE